MPRLLSPLTIYLLRPTQEPEPTICTSSVISLPPQLFTNIHFSPELSHNEIAFLPRLWQLLQQGRWVHPANLLPANRLAHSLTPSACCPTWEFADYHKDTYTNTDTDTDARYHNAVYTRVSHRVPHTLTGAADAGLPRVGEAPLKWHGMAQLTCQISQSTAHTQMSDLFWNQLHMSVNVP